jgi:hypothetical protein
LPHTADQAILAPRIAILAPRHQLCTAQPSALHRTPVSLPLLVMAAASMNALLDKALDDVSKVMQHGFDPKVVKKVQDLIDMDDGKTAVNTIWQDVQEVFKQEGIGDIDAYVRVETLIFHISNRGGLGGSAHDAQKNGDSIIEKGADPKKLADAVCIDLCPIEPLRSLQIKFMQNLVDRSKGMFAPCRQSRSGHSWLWPLWPIRKGNQQWMQVGILTAVG